MGFTPVTKVTKVIMVFWDLLGAKKNVDLERYVSFGSYELLVSNVDHKMNEK